jgi:hypothetical protein
MLKFVVDSPQQGLGLLLEVSTLLTKLSNMQATDLVVFAPLNPVVALYESTNMTAAKATQNMQNLHGEHLLLLKAALDRSGERKMTLIISNYLY